MSCLANSALCSSGKVLIHSRICLGSLKISVILALACSSYGSILGVSTAQTWVVGPRPWFGLYPEPVPLDQLLLPPWHGSWFCWQFLVIWPCLPYRKQAPDLRASCCSWEALGLPPWSFLVFMK